MGPSTGSRPPFLIEGHQQLRCKARDYSRRLWPGKPPAGALYCPRGFKKMASTFDRLSYAARQTARVAWYAGHYAAGRRLLKPVSKPDYPIGPTPDRKEMTAAMREVF